VFLTKRAPLKPINSHSVGSTVRLAIVRSGVVAPNHGSHLLRHSAAVEMLRQGISLRGVGQVLRHRHIETTEIYAKVDFERLKTIAQPWPEVTPC
jgi:site-specific recombinase XerD